MLKIAIVTLLIGSLIWLEAGASNNVRSPTPPGTHPKCTIPIPTDLYISVRKALADLGSSGELENILKAETGPFSLEPSAFKTHPAEIRSLERRILAWIKSRQMTPEVQDDSYTESENEGDSPDIISEIEAVSYVLEDIIVRPHCRPSSRLLEPSAQGSGRLGDTGE